MPATAKARIALTLLQAPAAPAASRVDSIMAAESAADNATNADATAVETHVTATAEAHTALTLVQGMVSKHFN